MTALLATLVFVVQLGGHTPSGPMDPYEEHRLLLQHAANVETARAEAQAAREEQAAREAAAQAAYEAEKEAAAAKAAAASQPAARNRWDQLADCESGNWIDGGRTFEEGSARWWWAKPGTELPPWGTTIHHGGLQFHPGTWTAYRNADHPTYAYDATREQQIAVAEKVLAAQGWGAWPTCASKLGWR